jgi:DNA-binding winged helix-turn-helix (wHTH) protein
MSLEIQLLYEFGKFRCIPRQHLLLCGDKVVALSPKSFEILVALIHSNGRLLTKEELMRQVWPDSFVEEANLTVNISAPCKAFGVVWQLQSKPKGANGGSVGYRPFLRRLGLRHTRSLS